LFSCPCEYLCFVVSAFVLRVLCTISGLVPCSVITALVPCCVVTSLVSCKL
jgi:hypothetical protein